MKRILIDLTDLELWGGFHGGTQRVTYGIAKQFFTQQESLDYKVQYMSFHSQRKAFFATSFYPILQRVEAISKTAESQPHISRKEVLRIYLLRYSPSILKNNPQARKLAKRFLTTAVRIAKKTNGAFLKMERSIRSSKSSEPINFTSDDVILILGKPWDDLNIQRRLSREKQRVNFKLVQIVYDLIIPLYPHLHHPSLFKKYTQHMFEAAQASDLMLPISGSSDRDLKEFCRQLNIPAPKTRIIRLGDEVINTTQSRMPDNRIAKKFLACIGTIEIRKNHTFLYYVYKLAQEKGINLPQLVIVGSRGWLANDFQYLVSNDPAVKDRIIILDNVDDSGIEWIYKHCLFSIYPSMYEGWGLPVAESLARGKVCVASSASSISEIGGDLLEYFSPYDTQMGLDTITKYLNEEILKKKEVEITKNYKTTTWEHTFTQVYMQIKKL